MTRIFSRFAGVNALNLTGFDVFDGDFRWAAAKLRTGSRIRFVCAFCFSFGAAATFGTPFGACAASAEELRPVFVVAPASLPNSTTAISPVTVAAIEYSMFPKVRALSLFQVRELATKRNTRIALASAKLGSAQADLKEQRNRLKVNTAGGLDPFSGQVRFYLNLDLERLLQLNKTARDKARQDVTAQQIGHAESVNATIKEATVAWYSLRKSEAGVVSASRYHETAQALYVAADARFKAGASELSNVLAAMDGTHRAEDARQTARQQIALDCLDLAQSCGYATAEEMEAAL